MGGRVFRSRSASLASAFVLAVSAMGPVDASSAFVLPVATATVPVGTQDPLEEDAAVAASQGMDYDVTLGRSRAQNRLTAAVDALSTNFDSSFGGLRWGDGLSLVAQFRGQPPSKAIQVLNNLELPFAIEPVAYSAVELDLLFDDVHDKLGALASHASVALDPVTQTIIVTANPVGSAISEGPDGVASRLRQQTGARVRVEFTDRPLEIDLTAYGGGQLYQDFQTMRCTTGFTVIGSSSVTGVATAGHCTTTLPEPSAFYDDPYLTGNHDITLKLRHDGAWGDFAYYTTSGAEGGTFYYGNGSTKRDVIGIKTTYTVLDPLNWYGRKTNATQAGSVWVTNYTAPSGRGRLACVVQKTAQTGDSGGPVFNGSTAAGFISSLNFIDGDYRMCFSKTMYIDDALPGTVIKI